MSVWPFLDMWVHLDELAPRRRNAPLLYSIPSSWGYSSFKETQGCERLAALGKLHWQIAIGKGSMFKYDLDFVLNFDHKFEGNSKLKFDSSSHTLSVLSYVYFIP